MKAAISCPKCGVGTTLIVRMNPANGSKFLGCPNWPACDHTQPVPEAWVMAEKSQPTLFDVGGVK